MSQSVEPKIYNLIERIVVAEEFELVHCEFSGERSQTVLRVYIDKPGGITHEDCSYISNQLSAVLDVEDLIKHHYMLEVSSPGVNRGLYKESDYARFAGQTIKLKTHNPVDGRRNFRGRCAGIEDGRVKVADSKGNIQLIEFDNIASAHLDVALEELFRIAEERRR